LGAQVREVLLGLARRQGPPVSAARNSLSRSVPPLTSAKHSNSTPSSSIVRLKGGIEPGVIPPMSA